MTADWPVRLPLQLRNDVRN